MEKFKLLPNTHISAETAYMQDDYPYGYVLRCKKRSWLDVHKTRGVRLMEQTTDPRRPGVYWNKPKASTYSRFAGAMILVDEEHNGRTIECVRWVGLDEYSNGKEAADYVEKFGAGVPEAAQLRMKTWAAAKAAYDQARKPGDKLTVGLQEAHSAMCDAAREHWKVD